MSPQIEIPDVPGDPDGVIAAASALDGAGAQLTHVAAAVARYANGMEWSGLGATMARTAAETHAAPLKLADAACSEAAVALRLYAHVLRDAQKASRQARAAAEDAAAAATRAQTAADAAATAPVPDPVAHSAAMNRVNHAQDDMIGAAAVGLQAYEEAKLAASALASVLGELAAAAPEPPPPPAAPKSEQESTSWWGRRWDDAQGAYSSLEDAWGAVGGMGDPTNPHSPAFSHDVIDGAISSAIGTGEMVVTLAKSSNEYGGIDPKGQQEAKDELTAAGTYAIHHPLAAGGAMLGVDDVVSGHPGRVVGELGLDALVALATGGAGATTRVVSGTSRAAEDAARLARVEEALADDPMGLQPIHDLGPQDYSRGFDESRNDFADPSTPVREGSLPDLMVNIGDGSLVPGSGRNFPWLAPLDEMAGLHTEAQIRDALALPDRWTPDGPLQIKDDVAVVQIPGDASVTYREGPAAPKDLPHEGHVYPGGGTQVRIKEIDGAWVIGRIPLEHFLEGHLPPLPPGAGGW